MFTKDNFQKLEFLRMKFEVKLKIFFKQQRETRVLTRFQLL